MAAEENATGQSSREPYEAPAIDQQADFETLALSCGKLEGSCDPYYEGVGSS